MTKKKEQEHDPSRIITTVLIILLVLAVIVIVWQVVLSIGEPEFKFTKDVCKNRTTTRCEMSQEEYEDEFCVYCDEKFGSREDLLGCADERNNCQEAFFDLYCKDIISDIEICEQVEVEEIEVELNCDTQDYNREDYPEKCSAYGLYRAQACLYDCYWKNGSYTKTFKDDPERYDFDGCSENCEENYVPKQKISKQEITKEWLDDICKCEEICSPEYDGLPPSECKAKYCYKYKCGEYTVEIK